MAGGGQAHPAVVGEGGVADFRGGGKIPVARLGGDLVACGVGHVDAQLSLATAAELATGEAVGGVEDGGWRHAVAGW